MINVAESRKFSPELMDLLDLHGGLVRAKDATFGPCATCGSDLLGGDSDIWYATQTVDRIGDGRPVFVALCDTCAVNAVGYDQKELT